MKSIHGMKGNIMQLKAEQICSKGLKIKEDKTNTLVKLLIDFINRSHENDILPNKKEVSLYFGISIGTVQNAYRMLEDKGFVQSKQKVGTIITSLKIKKQSSKRDYCVNLIKEYIKKHNIKDLNSLPSVRTLAKEFNVSPNTIGSAINMIKAGASGSDKTTLVQKIENELELYIKNNFTVGQNIPSLNALAKKMNVSVKTIHDAVKSLTDRKILAPHRGRYGTMIINMPDSITERKEDSIFAPAKVAEFYFYEKVQSIIKKMIISNYNIGDKLPSVTELSKEMNMNSNTIRKALKYLEEDGYVTFERGRYGGTFVANTPEEYKWVIVNPQYVAEYN